MILIAKRSRNLQPLEPAVNDMLLQEAFAHRDTLIESVANIGIDSKHGLGKIEA